LPLNTENSWLYSPAMARLTTLTMVESGLQSFSIRLFRACAGPLPLTVAAARVFHPIKENLPGWSFGVLQAPNKGDFRCELGRAVDARNLDHAAGRH
jgi:hypothetical protein